METTKNSNLPAKHNKYFDVRRLVFTALMAALSYLLAQFLEFNIPIMPSFIKFDFSDTPALIAAVTMGPVSGICVCLIKNLIGCITSSTACIGELSNFILGAALVLPAGIISHSSKKFSRAVVGCLVGAAVMAAFGFVSNYFLIYPLYANVGWSTEVIIGLYQKINPNVNTLAECLLIFNVPFTFVKGLIAAIFSVLLYKRLRPIFNSMYREK
ncbi:MAG: ECF transporter S component [Oscillospiraceae bacterium]|nr:ECF transporter S component [Oscillospiraceae bacterium]